MMDINPNTLHRIHNLNVQEVSNENDESFNLPIIYNDSYTPGETIHSTPVIISNLESRPEERLSLVRETKFLPRLKPVREAQLLQPDETSFHLDADIESDTIWNSKIPEINTTSSMGEASFLLPRITKGFPVGDRVDLLPNDPKGHPVGEAALLLPASSMGDRVDLLSNDPKGRPVGEASFLLPRITKGFPVGDRVDLLPNDDIQSLSIQDSLLNDSRLTPNGNGSLISKQLYTQPPTNGQKWWAAVIFGFIFGLVSSPAAYYATSKIITKVGNNTTMEGPGPNFIGLLLHSIIFILIIRLILW